LYREEPEPEASLQLAGVKTGLLMNFNVTKIKSGIKRFVLLLRALRVLRGENNFVPWRESYRFTFSLVTHSKR
jgi:hypothetical protein